MRCLQRLAHARRQNGVASLFTSDTFPMPVSIRSRLLLLVLSVLLPGAAAALWIISQTYQAERQAQDRHLSDVTRALAMEIDLAATQQPAELQQLLARQGLPPDWVVQVIAPGGEVVAAHPPGLADAALRLTPELRQQRAPGRELTFEATAADGLAMSAYLNTTARGWTLVSAQPDPTLIAAMSPAVQKVAAGSLLLLGIAIFGALWAARRIIEPVHALKHAASRMQRGETMTGGTTGIVECDEVAATLATAADALRHSRSELERQVAEAVKHTREAEQRISRSQHIEALGRLTGGVAHDFNNLLGVISNSAHLMQRQNSAIELQQPLAATLRAVAVGSRLTQQLLRFAAQQPICAQPVELAQMLPWLRELMQTVLGARIEVTVAVAPNTPRVTIDSNELELALTNLTLNARDAMPLGGHLSLQARRAHEDEVPDLPDGDYVLITLSDDGLGIDDDVAGQVFEPFFTTKEVGQGTGLSLAQVMGFCKQAGGTARLTSTEGLGTTVSLLLPARDEISIPAAPAPQIPDSQMPSIDGARLLLVEDNDDLAAVTAALLGRLGCEVRRAADSQGALRLIANEPAFDVVLSDIRMPGGMDGLSLARVLRDHCPDLPVVLISGYAAQTLDGEDFVVLLKPCPPTALIAALHDAIEGPAAHRVKLRQSLPLSAG